MAKNKVFSTVSSAGALLTLFAMVLAGCGSNSGNSSSSSSSAAASPTAIASAPASAGSDWAARKASNEKAGKIRYMTGFYFGASPPDLEVAVADELGYFKDLGLDVEIQGGLDSEGMKFLAADKIQIASAGAPSLVIQSVASGAGIKGIATFGAKGNSALMVMADSGITKPQDLVGKTIGYHGALPPNYTAMFKNEGIDPTSVKGVSVGYDPSVLSSGKVDALTVYKSNEPHIMESKGLKVNLIDPGDYGAKTSFGVIAANDEFAKEHPDTVTDFLRAVAKAHDWALANSEKALDMLKKRSQSGYDLASETNRWTVESKIVKDAQDPKHGVGWQTDTQWQNEIDMLKNAGVLTKTLAVTDVMDNQYLNSIYDGANLIWPNK
ncbi:ABC transporter substrate-binding protein [Paenibacillus sp. NPDC057934]|uniref:ABC transporter substrate-binding protein n=1 Tax=Paenibacillus sp. NPDC057934 TaxID=3346282 RepID=UPI0036DA5D99